VKKMSFGALLLMCGIMGIITIYVLSTFHPWDYNGITGFRGYLLGSKTLWTFIVSCIMSAAGITICFYEAYIRK